MRLLQTSMLITSASPRLLARLSAAAWWRNGELASCCSQQTITVAAAMSTTAVPPPAEPATLQKAIEVETKFSIPPGIEANITGLGGSLLHEKSFRDTYYDSRSSHLYLRDYWLRRRGRTWELKFPPRGLEQRTRGSTQYTELESEAEIIDELSRVLPAEIELLKTMGELDLLKNEVKDEDETKPGQGQNWVKIEDEAEGKGELGGKWQELSLDGLVDGYLVEIASYVTQRKTYRVEDFLVVLDEADFGYRLGEIEKVVYCAEDVMAAKQGIDEVAGRLGICVGGPRIPGKISMYLKQENPQLFARLHSKLVKDGKMDV